MTEDKSMSCDEENSTSCDDESQSSSSSGVKVKKASCCPPKGNTTPFVRNEQKVGRNDPCPCDSGLKFKKCCGKLG